MRLIVWNCAMGLHKKWERLLALRPDVAIVPECASPEVLRSRRGFPPDCEAQWVGDNVHKGLGVFAFHGLSMRRDNLFDDTFKQFLPVTITGPTEFTLLAVWAFNRRVKTPMSYGAATLAAINHYEAVIKGGQALVAGDFNNSTVWDRPGKIANFAALAARLEEFGLVSAYHSNRDARFGEEPEQTLFWRKGSREYHIDYCFLPRSWDVTGVEVGRREHWIDVSDHAPLLVECAVTHDSMA